MLRENFDHGFPESVWSAAKEEARRAMIEAARSHSTISYSDLVGKITRCSLQPSDVRLHHMLGEISRDEDKAGRGLLTAVVVRKEDRKPGSGFFRLAIFLGRSMGRSTAAKEHFWSEELKRVYGLWSQ